MQSTLVVTESVTIGDLNVTLDINHTRDEDLDVVLVGPDGTRVELMTDVGGSGINFEGTVLDDEAAFSITSGSAPFAGSYQPEGLLSDLDGKSAQGTWTLEVTDDKNRKTGTLNSWSIEVTPASPVLPNISIDDVQLVEGDSGTTALVFTVSRSGDTSGTSSVDFATTDGTASAGSDYVAASGTLQFLTGESSKTITVLINGDNTIESDETFTVELSNPTDAMIVNGQGLGTILDDDLTPTISFTDFSEPIGLTLVGAASAPAGTDNVLRLTPAIEGQNGAAWYTAEKQFVSVDWETTFDFNLNENFHSPGGSDGFVFIVQNHDPTYLAGGGGALGYNNLQNSLAVEFDTYQNSNIGDTSQSHISVHTNGTGPNGWDESLSLGSYSTPSIMDDAITHTARIHYTPGTLNVFLDDLANPVLTVSVDLAETLDLDVGRAWVGFTAATGGGWQNHDILNWDYRVLVDTTTTIAIDRVSQLEGDAGTTDFVFTVSRLGDTSGTTTVDWATSDGTATTASGDYVAASGQLTFTAGVTQQTITIPVNGDMAEEAHETFIVNLSGAVGGIIADDEGVGTILNDDVSISIDDVTVFEGDEINRFIDNFITAGSGAFDGPNAMAIGPDGNFYIAGQTSDNILRYDPATGELIDEFISLGSGGHDGPRGLIFGADGNLYVISSSTDSVLRYQGPSGANPGQFIDTFVPAGSGGLDSPYRATFGPDGNLFVSNTAADSVLRYQGPFDSDPGQFIDTFVAVASGGLDAPTALVFDVDGNLYVSSAETDNVLRYQGPSDSTPGQFIDTFVATASGGLDSPHALIFGADGNLYVSSAVTDSVLRYEGPSGSVPGQFIDAFVPTGSGGLDSPRELTFGADGNLYVVSKSTSEVLRYGVSSQAVFTVSLSSPSGEIVTVDFATADGTATTGADYTAVSGTVVFEPGVTQRVIVVPTIDDAIEESDETFVVDLNNPSSGANIADSQGVATITDQPLPPEPTKFFVVDDDSNQTFEYGSAGNALTADNWNLDGANASVRGAAASADGSTVWAIDSGKKVYVYDNDGALSGSWSAKGGLKTPTGIASDGTDIWIADTNGDKVLRYSGAASRTSGNQGASSSFSLAASNPSGITTDGTTIWVVDSGTDRVYRYDTAGSLQCNWALTAGNSSPTGLTIDPSGASSSIWVVDNGADAVYEYDRITGTFAGSFALAVSNTNPQGIADPPPALLPAENDAVSAAQLADRYFAAAAWKMFQPTTTEAEKVQSNPLETSPSELSTDRRQWSANRELQRSESESNKPSGRDVDATDRALVDLSDGLLTDDLLVELALAVSS